MISLDELKAIVKEHGILKKTRDGLTSGYLLRTSLIHDIAIKLN